MDSALNNILQPGTMFEVVKPTKDTTFGVGTLGVISYIEGYGQEFPNVVYYKIVTMRRGKTGKDRIALNQISTPVFTPNCSNLKRILPDINNKYFVFIKPNYSLTGKSIFAFEDHQFLSWAYAYTRYLSKLYTLATKVDIWPQNSDHILNRIYRFETKFVKDQPDTIKTYTTQQFKEAAVSEIRYFESMLASCGIDYLYKVAQIKKEAIHVLIKNAKSIKLENVELFKRALKLIMGEIKTLENARAAREKTFIGAQKSAQRIFI